MSIQHMIESELVKDKQLSEPNKDLAHQLDLNISCWFFNHFYFINIASKTKSLNYNPDQGQCVIVGHSWLLDSVIKGIN